MQTLTWHTKEYFHREKTADWYWMVGIITVSLAIIAVIMGDVIFGILIIISSFTLTLFASKKPEIILVEINDLGINLGKIHYPYTHLDSFAVETREIPNKMFLKSKKVFMPLIVVFIEGVSSEEVRNILKKNLKEEELTEPFLEKLLVYLGF
jgi:hypothetical protein